MSKGCSIRKVVTHESRSFQASLFGVLNSGNNKRVRASTKWEKKRTPKSCSLTFTCTLQNMCPSNNDKFKKSKSLETEQTLSFSNRTITKKSKLKEYSSCPPRQDFEMCVHVCAVTLGLLIKGRDKFYVIIHPTDGHVHRCPALTLTNIF